MTDRPLGTPQSAPALSDDPTRDVRLPSLSERPPAAVAQAPDVPDRFPTADPTILLEPRIEQPAPFAESLRQQTRPFGTPGDQVAAASGPEPARRPVAQPPAAAVAPGPPARSGGRPWTWVLLAVLPIVVIAVAGVLLYILLGGA
jgi:hypothetical protein